jgi:hypothetical protein
MKSPHKLPPWNGARRNSSEFSLSPYLLSFFNVGLTPDAVRALASRSENPKEIWLVYLQFVQTYSTAHLGVDEDRITEVVNAVKAEINVQNEGDLEQTDLVQKVKVLCETKGEAKVKSKAVGHPKAETDGESKSEAESGSEAEPKPDEAAPKPEEPKPEGDAAGKGEPKPEGDGEAAQGEGEAPPDGTAKVFPDDPETQLRKAIEHVLLSWDSESAIEARREEAISENLGLAIVVQEMVLTPFDKVSAIGSYSTRNPSTGGSGMIGNYLVNGQGSEFVARSKPVQAIATLEAQNPAVFEKLADINPRIEKRFNAIQQVAFAIANHQFYVIQNRSLETNLLASIKVNVDFPMKKYGWSFP